MYVRSTRNRIAGISHRRRESTNGSRQSPRSQRLGTPQKPQRAQRVDGIHQLLSKIHTEFLENRKSTQRTHQERSTMGMDGRTRRSIPETKATNMRQTSTAHAKTRATLRTRSGRFKLRNRRNAKSKRRTRTLAPGSLLLHDPLRNREELRHLRQGIISSRKIPSSLEDLPGRSPTSNRHTHGPLQPTILEGAEED